jgi:hypothetical protein
MHYDCLVNELFRIAQSSGLLGPKLSLSRPPLLFCSNAQRSSFLKRIFILLTRAQPTIGLATSFQPR